VEEVFGFIRLPKDDRDPLLREFVPEKRSRMVHIIKVSCNKELQKKMGGKMKFCFDPQETRIWLELIV
jgi:ethanolamine utilization microcompartment shell protein EutS